MANSDAPHPSARPSLLPVSAQVSAIVPARNEEDVLAACLASLLPQPELAEILVINDQSTDRTGEIAHEFAQRDVRVRVLDAPSLPPGWVGKNHAVWIGAQQARSEWLLFTDADAVLLPGALAKTLRLAQESRAAIVSYSPEQVMERWYEKALIPYIYTRLARHFSFAEVNDPAKPAAAANGQFLLVRRDAYDAAGGHAAIAADVLEDVALASRVKGHGFGLWFGPGKGVVRVRMYRSFGAMWEGWKKNLYRLMGGARASTGGEIGIALFPLLAVLIATITMAAITESAWLALTVLVVGLAILLVLYEGQLREIEFPSRLAPYGLPGRVLFAGVLFASYRAFRKGRLKWKGREYPISTPRASKD